MHGCGFRPFEKIGDSLELIPLGGESKKNVLEPVSARP
jgi:hypothetical protein